MEKGGNVKRDPVKDPHSRNLRLHRCALEQCTFFITKSIQPRIPVLDPALRAIICSSIRFAVEQKRMMLGAFVVMPDHWHALIGLRGDWTISRLVHSLMSHIGAETKKAWRRRGAPPGGGKESPPEGGSHIGGQDEAMWDLRFGSEKESPPEGGSHLGG
jgi:REP element-mobilizing transposase RayT